MTATREAVLHIFVVLEYSFRGNSSSSFKFYYVFYIKWHEAMQCSQLAKASRGEQCLQKWLQKHNCHVMSSVTCHIWTFAPFFHCVIFVDRSRI